MNCIPKMVDALRSNPEVVGLIEYGSAQHSDEEIHGDYDLIVVVEERDPELESLHFHVAGVPVDLNIRSLDDICDTWCAVGFDAILLDGRIIHDPSGRLKKEIKKLKQRDAEAPRGQSNPNTPGMRHGHRHILDKVRDRRESMPPPFRAIFCTKGYIGLSGNILKSGIWSSRGTNTPSNFFGNTSR